MRKKPLIQIFADNLKATRLRAGISQVAVAQLTGLDRTYVGSVERGERNISLENVERLAKAFKLEAFVLLKEKKKMTDPKKLSTEELLEWIDRMAVSWIKSRKPEFLVTWKRLEDERKSRERSIWNWFRR